MDKLISNLQHGKRKSEEARAIQHCVTPIPPQFYMNRYELLLAATHGNIHEVQTLLRDGVNIEATNSKGQTALCLSAMGGSLAVTEVLLANGADANAITIDLQTPLTYAAKHGHLVVAKLLLEHSDCDPRDSSWRTPLSYAAEHGHHEVVRLLLDCDACVDSRDFYYHRTPLSYAAKAGQKAVILILLERGADRTKEDIDRRTPLCHAAMNGHDEVVKLLLEVGDNEIPDFALLSYATAANGRPPLPSPARINPDTLDSWQRTPLSYAAAAGHREIVSLLVKSGADGNIEDLHHKTPLDYAENNCNTSALVILCGYDTVCNIVPDSVPAPDIDKIRHQHALARTDSSFLPLIKGP